MGGDGDYANYEVTSQGRELSAIGLSGISSILICAIVLFGNFSVE